MLNNNTTDDNYDIFIKRNHETNTEITQHGKEQLFS